MRVRSKETHLVAIERLVKIYCLLKEICHLLSSRVAGIAARLEGANACTVLVPLVAPERRVVAALVFPVRLHVRKDIALPERSQER